MGPPQNCPCPPRPSEPLRLWISPPAHPGRPVPSHSRCADPGEEADPGGAVGGGEAVGRHDGGGASKSPGDDGAGRGVTQRGEDQVLYNIHSHLLPKSSLRT